MMVFSGPQIASNFHKKKLDSIMFYGVYVMTELTFELRNSVNGTK